MRMKIEHTLPTSKRDLRLDLFRGLANWAMFLGHIPTGLLAWLSFRNYGFSDGADLFVFISGYTSAAVFARKMTAGQARLADLCRPHSALRVLSGFDTFAVAQP